MDLKGVFNSEPKSLLDTIGAAGLCFYLPAYQRPYTWNKKNIDRVFEDVLHGIENSMRNEDAITFIGTLLTIHDTKFQTIVPHKKGEVPSKVMLVIDGQQRLTTMLLITTVLFDKLKINESKFQIKLEKLNKKLEKDFTEDESCKNEEVDCLEWLLDELSQEIANLRHFSTDTSSTRDKVYRWYPKLIRAYKDCWSKTRDGAQYDSPIASYLHQFNNHVLGNDEGSYKAYKYKSNFEKNSEEYELHKIILQNLDAISKNINTLCKDKSTGDELLALPELLESQFSTSFQFDIHEYLQKNLDADEYSIEKETLKLIAFSKYFLNRVCVTFVTVADETYAFDMFEALNTTGEPLTSIETFKPKVIEDEGLPNFEQSVSKQHFDVVDSFLDPIDDARKKYKATTRVMLAFALAETGTKITTHISDQRRYLIDSYKDESPQEKQGFVKNLAHVTQFIYEEWDYLDQPKCLNDSTIDEDNILRLCLEVLKDAKHEITLPLITRFYCQYLDNKKQEDSFLNLKKAMKSIVAFFVLWRAAHKTTSGIDAVYRDILRTGDSDLKIAAFSRRSTQHVSANKLSQILKEKLKKN